MISGTQFQTNLTSGVIHSCNELLQLIESGEMVTDDYLITASDNTVTYNIPCSFDIETTSFFQTYRNDEMEPLACMYIWQFGINGIVFIGRTWAEFLEFTNNLCDILQLGPTKNLIVYVHNLAFEFQFIRKLFKWKKVFSLHERKPVYAETETGILFKCSYILSGYSLAVVGKNLHKYKVEKLSGDLDYRLMRNSETELTEKEIAYCVNDVKVVMAYIQECIEDEEYITRIPLTKTGYVRRECKRACFYNQGKYKKSGHKYERYRKLMDSLQLNPDEYKQLKRAFQGGFTHASAWKTGKIWDDVGSFDLVSSYPAVMVAYQFPMSTSREVEITSKEQFYELISKYCCIFDCEITGLESTTIIEHPISYSKCFGVVKPLVDNGRLVSADKIYMTITEQDYFVYEKYYSWESFKVFNFRCYLKGYLPSDLVGAILDFYEIKTRLKGVEGKEIEYAKSKNNVNSAYGMMVTDIVRELIEYNEIDEWESIKPDLEKAINKYNKAKKRFLFYPWGIYVTAYARRIVLESILQFGTDYIYSDTDSIKALNPELHMPYIESYNKRITAQIEKALEYHGFFYSKASPKTIKGIKKPLGIWEYECKYQKFKTLGAKRYIYVIDDEISLTVSGINKKTAIPYLRKKYGSNENVMEAFTDDLYIPPGYSGKNIMTYIDYETQGTLTDYQGHTAEFHELSSVNFREGDYTLNLSLQYLDYLKGLKLYEE